jgi:hypothetical protein
VLSVHLKGIRIAKLHFSVEIALQSRPAEKLHTKEERYNSAFASYASEDRHEVLARLQGMQKAAPWLDVFVDILSLRSGERWEERLNQEISRRDVFYLFWSQAASQSVWVDKEWRSALQLRGIDYIDPVPLAPPDQVPPPKELADLLHFNDWVLAYIRGGPPGNMPR